MAEAKGERMAAGLLSRRSIICAPMVDQSELAFRMLCRHYGAKLCYTPMLHSKIFQEDERYRNEKMTTCPEDRPLVIQLCGHDPDMLLKTALQLQDKCDAIDINLGCPQNIARRGNYGAFLLENTERVGIIVEHLSKHLSVPLFCKIRIFPDRERTFRLVDMLQEKGCKLLTVHGRTKEENKICTQADWKIISEIKARLTIPVVCNGSIGNLKELDECLRMTNCDAVMSSEALLESPVLFDRRIHESDLPMPSQFDVSRKYLEFADKYPGSTMKMKRSHLFRFLHGAISEHPEYRQIIGVARDDEFVHKIAELEMLHEKERGSNAATIPKYDGYGWWYMRHRDNLVQVGDKIMTVEKKRKLEQMQPNKISVQADNSLEEPNPSCNSESGCCG